MTTAKVPPDVRPAATRDRRTPASSTVLHGCAAQPRATTCRSAAGARAERWRIPGEERRNYAQERPGPGTNALTLRSIRAALPPCSAVSLTPRPHSPRGGALSLGRWVRPKKQNRAETARSHLWQLHRPLHRRPGRPSHRRLTTALIWARSINDSRQGHKASRPNADGPRRA